MVLTRQLWWGIDMIVLLSRLVTRKALSLWLEGGREVVLGALGLGVVVDDVGVEGFSMAPVSWHLVSGSRSFSMNSMV